MATISASEIKAIIRKQRKAKSSGQAIYNYLIKKLPGNDASIINALEEEGYKVSGTLNISVCVSSLPSVKVINRIDRFDSFNRICCP